MDQATHYTIRGGVPGRERLRVLGRVMRPTTLELFDRIGIMPGMQCVDVGCGGGDVSLDLAHRVGPAGKVVGLDIDSTKLELARSESRAARVDNVEFLLKSIDSCELSAEFDIAYARFLLTHLPDPLGAIRAMCRCLKRGGTLVIEEIDFRGHFCYPASSAFDRYVELYTRVVQTRGGDPNIGPRVPALLADAGLGEVGVRVVQPAGMTGEVKLMSPLTLENITDAVVAEGLASRRELVGILGELYAFAEDPRTLMSIPRVVQAWARRDAA